MQQALKGTVLLQVDVTKNSPQDVALLKHLQVLGLPTILFFNAEGQEQPERRVTGLWMPRHSAPICAIGKRERHFRRKDGGEHRAT